MHFFLVGLLKRPYSHSFTSSLISIIVSIVDLERETVISQMRKKGRRGKVTKLELVSCTRVMLKEDLRN
jgi:hypothetical protein